MVYFAAQKQIFGIRAPLVVIIPLSQEHSLFTRFPLSVGKAFVARTRCALGTRGRRADTWPINELQAGFRPVQACWSGKGQGEAVFKLNAALFLSRKRGLKGVL